MGKLRYTVSSCTEVQCIEVTVGKIEGTVFLDSNNKVNDYIFLSEDLILSLS